MTGGAMRGWAVAVLCAAALSPVAVTAGTGAAAPAIVQSIGKDGVRNGIELVSSPRREKYCKDNETGSSTAAKEKSYKDCLKNWR
ncbi:MAG: hypothetical protein U1F33_14905 [Alphaproteobacteria bacterium]